MEVIRISSTKVLRPSGTGFEWCINQYDGCAHGCKYCYGMVIRRRKYEDWIQPSPRENVISNLRKDVQKLRDSNMLNKIGNIFVGSITDSYQPIEKECQLTRQIIAILVENELPFTLLTKSDLILRDIDLLRGYRYCRAGVTITSLDDFFRSELEPFAPSYQKRIEALAMLQSNGICTYCSVEPIFPVKEVAPIAIVQKLRAIVDLFEFGIWNRYRYRRIPKYYWEDYSEKFYYRKFYELVQFCDEQKINYCIASHSEHIIDYCDLPSKPHPRIK